MKTFISALAMATALAGAAAAQPSGGPDAKGNAPVKPSHTVNDGAPKAGHNSFTQGQARTHIEKAGFTGVSGLVKGDDGVWRGHAMRAGQPTDVAMDFKGNVSTPGMSGPGGPPPPMPMGPPPRNPPPAEPAPMARSETTTTTMGAHDMAGSVHHRHRMRHHRRRHHHGACANPSPNGAACSGVDKNGNGISDREDHAINHGAHP